MKARFLSAGLIAVAAARPLLWAGRVLRRYLCQSIHTCGVRRHDHIYLIG